MSAFSAGGALGTAMIKPLLRRLLAQATTSLPTTQTKLNHKSKHSLSQLFQLRSSKTKSTNPKFWRKALRQIWESTWKPIPNTTSNVARNPFSPAYAPLPIYPRNGPNSAAEFARGTRSGRIHPSPSRSFTSLSNRFNPSLPQTGAARITSLGLQPSAARRFSSFGATHVKTEVGKNVPLGMRALAELVLNGDDERRERKQQVLKVRGVKQQVRKMEARWQGNKWRMAVHVPPAMEAVFDQQTEGETDMVEDLNTYFPLPTSSARPFSNAAPEEDDSFNGTTYLLIPLHPTLDYLFPSSPSAPQTADPASPRFLSPEEPEIPRVPALLAGIPSLLQALQVHSSHRVIPLLNRLCSSGLLDDLRTEESWTTGMNGEKVVGEVIFGPPWGDGEGEREVEALRIGWKGVSEEKVRRVLGEHKRSEEWWHVYSVPGPDMPSTDERGSVEVEVKGDGNELEDEADIVESSISPTNDDVWRFPTRSASSANSEDRTYLMDEELDDLGNEETMAWRSIRVSRRSRIESSPSRPRSSRSGDTSPVSSEGSPGSSLESTTSMTSSELDSMTRSLEMEDSEGGWRMGTNGANAAARQSFENVARGSVWIR